MRKRKTNEGLTVNGIAGTSVVLLGFNLTESARRGCLGFAIKRERIDTGEVEWLRGMKCFEATQDDGGEGDGFRSNKHPFQSFQWADYAARPDTEYVFEVIALYGEPSNLVEGPRVRLRLRTEPEFGQTHSIFFNRGAAASQAYARRFNNLYPDDERNGPGYNAAYKWLSRGLFESLIGFVARAKDSGWSIRAAIYEFQWPPTVSEFAAAFGRGVDVKVIIDAIDEKTAAKNRAAVSSLPAGICVERTRGTIMHNKFVVLLENGSPVAVWTGSTNQTENGIFGHSNVGHIVQDGAVAAKYLDYWNELSKDDDRLDEWLEATNPVPDSTPSNGITAIFSPHKNLAALELYAKIASEAKRGLFMTFAFGMHEKFQAVFEKETGVNESERKVLNLALMEKEGNGRGLAKGKIDIKRIRGLSNVIVAIGERLKMNAFDRWVLEMPKQTRHAGVLWVHTKYMLVDPIGPDPVIVTGSANFSNASTVSNHENMLILRGDTRVADIYIGEFMRLHSHYAFRETVAKNWNSPTWKPQFLSANDSWQDLGYFKKGNARFMKRLYFSGD